MPLRRDRLASDNFTIIPNEWLRDASLSWGAKGLLSYLASHHEGYVLRLEQILCEGTDGRRGVLSFMKELEGAGYLKRERQRRPDGKLGTYQYVLGHSAQAHTGPDQPERDVSAGGNQSAPDHSGAARTPKKTTPKKTKREDHSEADASAPAVDSENAGTITGAWIDWLKARDVIMPRNLIARVAKEIKGCLDSGIDPTTVKHGLALMHERGKAHSPSLVPSFVAEVQLARTGGAARSSAPANRHARPLHQKHAEQHEALKVADEYLEANGVDTETREGAKLVSQLADEIVRRGGVDAISMNNLDISMVQPYIQGNVINGLPAIGGAAQ